MKKIIFFFTVSVFLIFSYACAQSQNDVSLPQVNTPQTGETAVPNQTTVKSDKGISIEDLIRPINEQLVGLGLKPLPKEKWLPVLIFVFAISLASFIYSCLCLQLIAQKTDTKPSWLAWIPVANLFLMCKIAKLNYWWLLILLIAIIPNELIVRACMMFATAFIWFKIAQARNKPGWIGVLNVLPLVNFVAIGYLAFSGVTKEDNVEESDAS